jgi:predicted nuclease of predicted toxin-antitoxin system
MKFLANENFPGTSVKLLRESGYDVKSIKIECPGISDIEVMKIASKENRIILTFDRDYGELVYKHQQTNIEGVIYFRIKNITPSGPAKYLLDIFKNNLYTFNDFFTVIHTDYIRQRRLKP